MNSKKWWHRPRPTGFLNYGHQPSGATEYIDTYIEHHMNPSQSFKPTQVLHKTDEKVSDKTTFRVDYIPHPLTKHEPRPPDTYKAPEAAMEGKSMYRQDFPGHKTGQIQLIKRKEGRSVPLAKFEASPTYTTDFKRWSIPPRIKRGPDFQYKIPDVKMESVSTFQQDFIHRQAPPRQSAKPPDVAFKSDEPLDNNTIHKLNYVTHPLEARSRREKEIYLPPTVPMRTTTTFQTDFRGLNAPRALSMRPTQTAFQSTDPLATSSEFRDRFVAWPVYRPERREATKYVAPEGNIDLQTTQRLDFCSINGKPAVSVKPVPKLTKSLPFDGTTNYSNDFKKWNIQRNLAKPRQEYYQGEGKFDGLSTTRQHYVAHSGLHAAKSVKPDARAFTSDLPMDDKTLYKINYIPQSMREVERYPTPSWLKQQEEVWKRQGLLPESENHIPSSSARAVNVAA